jgi:uncharacterized membrane protein YdfJ with MMPL/SSD domain
MTTKQAKRPAKAKPKRKKTSEPKRSKAGGWATDWLWPAAIIVLAITVIAIWGGVFK